MTNFIALCFSNNFIFQCILLDAVANSLCWHHRAMRKRTLNLDWFLSAMTICWGLRNQHRLSPIDYWFSIKRTQISLSLSLTVHCLMPGPWHKTPPLFQPSVNPFMSTYKCVIKSSNIPSLGLPQHLFTCILLSIASFIKPRRLPRPLRTCLIQ